MSKLKVSILALSLVIVVAATAYWFNENPPGATMIDPARPPKDILEAAEVEKIRTLQNTNDVFLVGRVSPDDSTILVMSGSQEGSKQISWMDVQTGQLELIDSKVLDLSPQSEISWRDNQAAMYLSNNSNGDPVLVTLQRETGEVQTRELDIAGRPLSLAPNGSRLLIENSSKNGMELSVMDLESATIEKLLSYTGSTPLSMTWTADGSKLAILRLVVPGSVDETQGAEIGTQDALGQLPLDQNPFYVGNVIDIFDFVQDEFKTEVLRAEDDGAGYIFNKVVWSPDGQRLLAKMVRPSQPAGRDHPVVLLGQFADRSNYRVYDADLHLIETIDRVEIEAPNANAAPTAANAMFLSSDELLIVAAYGLNEHIFYFNLETGEFRRLATDPGTFDTGPGGPQVYATHQSRQVIYNQSSFQHPSEIYRLDLEGKAPQLLVQVNAPAVTTNRIRVDEVRFELSENVTRVGYLIQPAGAAFPPQNVPIVIHHQGGPGGAMTNRWGATPEDPFSLLPNFGISVLFMPFSGREGFGPEFYVALADGDNYGQIDVEESALAVQYMLEHGYATENQIGVNGCSYGGYLVNQSITQYADLFAVATSQCSIVDMADYWKTNPYLVTFYEGSVPEVRPEEYRRDAPIHQAGLVKTPLLLMQGMDDFLPVKLVRNFRATVGKTGTPVELLAFKNEGHSLTLPSSRLYSAQQQITWFRKYLTPQSSY